MTTSETFWFFNRLVSVSLDPRREGAFDCPACGGKGGDGLECCGTGIALCPWGKDTRCSVHAVALDENGPYAYLKYVLERLPTHPASRIDELLPYRWSPGSAVT